MVMIWLSVLMFSLFSFDCFKEKKDIKFINVATDYECIPFWNETNPDLFVIPSEKLISKFVEKGIKKTYCYQLVYLLHQVF